MLSTHLKLLLSTSSKRAYHASLRLFSA
jgi:protease II